MTPQKSIMNKPIYLPVGNTFSVDSPCYAPMVFGKSTLKIEKNKILDGDS
jgi:hypothetical protein